MCVLFNDLSGFFISRGHIFSSNRGFCMCIGQKGQNLFLYVCFNWPVCPTGCCPVRIKNFPSPESRFEHLILSDNIRPEPGEIVLKRIFRVHEWYLMNDW